MVMCVGLGMRLTDFPDIFCSNLSPILLRKMRMKKNVDKLSVPVKAVIPGEFMGSGIGSTKMAGGDYDIMTSDRDYLKKHRLDKLCLGDIVAITDQDNVFGRCLRKGAITIGVIIHADCLLAGHGPGVTTVLSCQKPLIIPRLSAKANIGNYLKIGRFR